MLGPFVRPVGINPLIQPKADSLFECPVQHKMVKWESEHTFNPAAIVMDGKVFVLYRAEDDSGTTQIGSHTSRLGLAESEDGLHFRRRGEPVFYPDLDASRGTKRGAGVKIRG